MSEPAYYFIAQHIADLFRRESRNIGVFVRIDDQIRAKFLGESQPGEIDASKIGMLPFPNVYCQWVAYWRRTITQSKADAAWTEIVRTARHNYQVLDAGIVDCIGDDSIDKVVDFLFLALVSEGGVASAIGLPSAGRHYKALAGAMV